MRYLFLLILLTGLSTAVFAQDELTGRVFESKTKNFLQGIRVQDPKANAMTITGPDGSFTIKAKIGDLVIFTNNNYKSDTLLVTNLKYVQIFLDLNQTMLQEVNITNQQIKGNAGFNPYIDKGVLGSNTVKYQRDDSGNYKGGVSFKIPDGSDSQRKHEEKVSAQERDQEKIRKVFNADTLKRYLPLTGQEMDNFVILYMPDRNTYFSFDFNIVAYLNRCYREFMKIPEDDRKSKSLTQLTPAKD